ncbi:protein kinase [Cryptococcus neoformans var. grubii Br795]|uniref:Protein kinase n=1 Tax=Cryptococcus neoformans Tu259-1 TaxID=1230072 RepID=A0A854Q2H9_CRYNE|nr:protein kinase [Cryptococcus neoformans var. grubii AD1-83a]OXG10747.1 protein kinase [Cryptococcus neoformans var. grubii Tu259-1]OXG26319.1 protein kinase [Cryptococcus neoformans var. grubii Bt15]OXG33333.1 protein kinase [Cryptococcus neoformans var. grubii Bt120]OXG43459.1 protein kinase [Cryptococcus neoformans var. grubii Th84]OXG45899.1 protein kinase [Cryptococcus neoformans var. grubii MW-RSA1955]OXG49498.1 protein kinase [Cryptococcus neoformans var. grubii CHC193]OXG57078.1 pr
MPSPEDSRFDTEIPQVIAGKYNVKVERQMAETNEESEPLEDLCKDLPEEFLKYLQYCRTLKFDSDPDYQYLRLLFHQLFLEKGYENDWGFDWCKKANNEGAAEEKDDKELLEANDKKNGNNAEKRNDISKELEGSNNVTNADTDRSNITSVNNTDLKQVSEAKGDQKAQNEIKAPSRSVNFDDHHAKVD